MGRPGRRPERLADLAQAVGANQDYPGIHLTRLPKPTATPQEIIAAQQALNQTRADQFESKKSFLHRKPAKSAFSAKEATSALNQLVQNGCSPGQAGYLISLGADVNFSRHKSGSVIKKVRKKDQDDIRSTLFRSAVEKGDPSLINVLADLADQDNRDQGLRVAISKRNLKVVEILMGACANPNLSEQAFREAVRNGDEKLVCILASGTVALSKELACQSLCEAVQSGCLRIVRILLWFQADADIESPCALAISVHAGNLPHVAALCSAKCPPSPQHLARTIASICTDMSSDDTTRLKMIEILLAAGGSGEEIAETLSNATKLGQNELVQLLADYSDFDVKHTPTAIKHAMSRGDLILFNNLIGMVQEPIVMDDLLAFLPSIRASISLQTKSTMTRTIAARRPSTKALSEALQDAANYREFEMTQYLVETGASVDHQSGLVMTTAVRLRSMQLLSILLTGRPSRHVLSHTLGLVTEMPLNLKLEMTRALLDAGAEGGEVDQALRSAIEKHDKSHESYELVQSLIRSKADVNVDNAICFVTSIRESDTKTIELLLQGTPNVFTLDTAFSLTVSVEELKTRYRVMKLLLIAGARGRSVDNVLCLTCEAHDRSKDSYRLIDLLIRGGADINTKNAMCLTLLVSSMDVKGVEILLRGRSHPTSLEKAFSFAAVVGESDIRFELMRLLLASGAQGRSVDQVLIDVIDGSPQAEKFSRLLVLNGKPDVNFQNGKSICSAVEYQDIELVRLLLDRQPVLRSLNRALTQAIKLNNPESRLQMCQVLLQAGSKGSALDEALTTIAQSSNRDIRLSKILLSYEASIDHNAGSALRAAVTRYDHELLELLLTRPVQAETLLRELEFVLKLDDEEQKIIMSKSLLSTRTSIPPESLGALLHLTFAKSDDLRLLRLFLDQGASVNHGSLEAFQKAIDNDHSLALEELLNANSTSASVRQVFEYAWKASTKIHLSLLEVILKDKDRRSAINMDQYLVLAIQHTPCLLPLIKLLLDSGAAVTYLNNQCMHEAAARFENQALKLLLEQSSNRNDVSAVLQKALQGSEVWDYASGVETVNLLLESGSFGDVVDSGLLQAVEKSDSCRNALDILDLLVTHRASSDYQNGQALEVATRRGNLPLVQRLFDSAPSGSTINNAFPYILSSQTDEETTLGLMNAFILRSTGKLDLNARHKELPPVLLSCMERWPNHTVVMEQLLEAGASANLTVDVMIEGAPAEVVTILLWALCKAGDMIGYNVVEMLITVSDVNFTTSRSRTTPLLAAVKRCRVAVVDKLLQHSANVSAVDSTGRTALCYAAAQDQIGIIQLLNQRGSPFNDGSLHDAVYHCKIAAATMLLEIGHDPNFPSVLYNFRPPLELLVVHSHAQSSWELETMFGLLFRHGANDMPHASHVTPALLSAFMSAIVNDECNVHRHNRLRYSPMSYLVHNKQLSPFSQKQALLQVLSSYGCKEMYYRDEGPQPDDFTASTAPAELVLKEKQRKDRLKQIADAEELHQIEQRRLHEAAAAREEEETRQHKAALRRAREQSEQQQRLAQQSHKLQLTQISEASQLQDRAAMESARQQRQIDHNKNAQLENFAVVRRNNEAAYARTLADRQLQDAKNQSQLQIENKKQLAIQEQKIVDARLEGERRLHEMARVSRREQEDADARSHGRNVQAIEAKRSLMAEDNKLLVKQKELLQLQASVQARQQQQIGYVEDVD